MLYKKRENIYNDTGEIKDKLLTEIILTAYGDASYWKRKRVERLASQHKKVAELLQQYKTTAISVHSLQTETCPEEIIQIANIRVNNNKENSKSIFTDILAVFYTKPLFSVSAAFAVAAALIFTIFFGNLSKPDQIQYSTIEINKANQQAKEAFKIIGQIFNKTKRSVERDIISKRVKEPIDKSFNTINQLFNEGVKNEKIN